MPGLKRTSNQSSVNNIGSDYKIITKTTLEKLYKWLTDFIQPNKINHPLQQAIFKGVDLDAIINNSSEGTSLGI